MFKYVTPEEQEGFAAQHYGESVAELRKHRDRYCSEKPLHQPTAAENNPVRLAYIRAKIAEADRVAVERAAKLETIRQFRIDVYGGAADLPARPKASPFRADQAKLVRAAHYQPVKARRHTVSGFKEWVHSLYHEDRKLYWLLLRGKRVERDLAERDVSRRRYRGHTVSDSDWEVIYRDIDPSGNEAPTKPISALSINGEPMWGRPDIVLRNRRTAALTIIERKASDAMIPVDGWPDLRAQLWCYAQIDDEYWSNAPTIRLVAEVWQPDPKGRQHELRVYEGGLLRWVKGDTAFDADNVALFSLYKQKIEEDKVALQSGQHNDEEEPETSTAPTAASDDAL